jgi:hypothetical protein
VELFFYKTKYLSIDTKAKITLVQVTNFKKRKRKGKEDEKNLLKSQQKRIVSIYTRPGNKEKYITAKEEK